ncbi:MAG: aldehyde dehydrogenase [Proteobacteria bacterium]|nr:aldehyde dehydrogenase [Pseudomonadota bacterium]
MSLPKYQHFINNEWCDPTNNMWYESFNPYTAKPWCLIPKGNKEDVELAIGSAHQAFKTGEWPTLTPTQRGQLLYKLGDLIAEHADKLAEIEVMDNGKLISEMSAQLHYLPQWFYYFGGLADKIEGSVIPIDKPQVFNYTRYEPLGVVVAITPWNSPLLLASWKIAPALAAGNTIVLKPSEFTSASAFEFAKLFKAAGFPPGVLNVISGFGRDIGDDLVLHPQVAKVAFTGGTETGKRVYENAAKGIKKVSLELGGKSPNIVFDDANIDNAVKGVISGIFAATGQTCIAGSRLLVQASIHDEFVDKIVKLAKTAKMGDPLSFETQVGPVSTEPQFEKILSYLKLAKEEGAHCVLGGDRAKSSQAGTGWFVEPSIYTHVHNKMRIAQEEIFGPVLAVIPFKDDEEAISIANDIPYGLAAGLWTNDIKRILELSNKLQAGTVWVNTYRMLSYLSPFGGYKMSGIGRESGKEAIYNYLQAKSVWISTQTETPNPFVMRLK